MFVRGTWRIGKIAGIEIAIHPTFLGVFALFAWSAMVVAPSIDPHLTRWSIFWLGIAYGVLLFASVVVHELSHALVARRLGIPIGNITLFLFGGVASILREPGAPSDELRMAAAGPAASVILSLVSFGLMLVLPDGWLSDLCFLLAWSNGLLAVFNLLPAFPSDGGRILRALLWLFRRSQAKATFQAGAISLVVAAALVVAGVYFALYGERATGEGLITVRGWWWILIGIFLAQAALASIRGARMSLILETMPVSECMARTLIPVPNTTTIAGFIAEMAVSGRGAGYPVVNHGTFVGLVTLQDTAAVPHALWQQTPITAVMTPAERMPIVPERTPASEALATLDARSVGELPVFENGTLTGVVSKESIFTELHARSRGARA